jgi:hypothetical protein
MHWIKEPAGYCTYHRRPMSIKQIFRKECHCKNGKRRCKHMKVFWEHEYWAKAL